MSKQLSTAGANFVHNYGWGNFFKDGLLMFYTGTQPTNGDAAATGTACVRFSKSAGAVTLETKATAIVGLAAVGANPTVLTVGGIAIASLSTLPTFSTAAQLAIDLAANINNTRTYPDFTASADSTNVTISPVKGAGATLNGLTVVCTASGGATINGGSSATLGGAGATAGVTAVNCLNLLFPPTAGATAKEATAWQGIGGSGAGTGYIGFVNSFTSGTQQAGWFRWYASPTDPELSGTPTADTGYIYLRFDGTIGVDLTATGGTTVTFGATQTQNSFTITVPTNQG